MALPASGTRIGFLWLLLASLVLLHVGFYNGFPLVTSDSGTYLNSALNLTVPDDRPITYGLFARVAGLGTSLWFVIFFQCLILAALLLRYIREFAPRITHPAGRLALLVTGVWATGVSWFSCQLMPDIFTPIGLLAMGLVVLGRTRSKIEQVLLLLLLLLSGIMHTSNLLTFTSTIVVMGALGWQQQWFRQRILSRSAWGVTAAVVSAGWVVLPTLHASFGGGFTLSRASPAFLMARLSETGILERFLNQECGANSYSLCAFRDKLPNTAIGFMWDPASPLNQAGGWNATHDEYQLIIGKILRSPSYYPDLFSEAVQATFRQLTHVGLGDGLTPHRENSNPYWKVAEYHSPELKEYMSSLQNQGALAFTSLNERIYLAYVLALVVGLCALTSRYARQVVGTAPVVLLFVLLGTGLVANAFVTGGLANVLDRLQARVAWLLPFMVLVLGTEMLLAISNERQRRTPQPLI